MKKIILNSLAGLAFLLLTQTPSATAADQTAVVKTSMGSFTVKLYKDKAPKTVANFVGLAKGTKEWTDPKTGKKVKGKSLYAGTIFHRVIPGFMIQGGDPLGSGTGGPGYQFDDEISPLDAFTRPGLLAMANAGPNTNGSQFFVTVAAATHLNQHYNLFGEVTKGQDIVDAISKVARNSEDRPDKEVKIISITIK
jgi:peptidyl-prolyl cis-trans isomerase A (cyclophilin A)